MSILPKNQFNITVNHFIANLLLASFVVVSLSFNAEASEEIVYYHNDALGSAVAATDENGVILWQEAYRPYGERILKQDNGQNDLWYTGKPEEQDLGVNYFGARWYDPTIGRFLAIDPVNFQESSPQSFNKYAYANNNPYKFVDPDGKFSLPVPITALDFDLKDSFKDGKNHKVKSKFGTRTHPVTKKKKKHNGIDLKAGQGTELSSPIDGKVTKSNLQIKAGGVVHIEGTGEYEGIKLKYFHLSKRIEQGAELKKGENFGESGGAKGTAGAGTSTGPHVHVEVYVDGKRVDPKIFLGD